MVFILSWHDHAPLNQKCHSSTKSCTPITQYLRSKQRYSPAVRRCKWKLLSFSVLHVKGSPPSSLSVNTLKKSVEVVITHVHGAHTTWDIPFFHVCCSNLFPFFRRLITMHWFCWGEQCMCNHSILWLSWQGLLFRRYASLKLSNEWLGYSGC